MVKKAAKKKVAKKAAKKKTAKKAVAVKAPTKSEIYRDVADKTGMTRKDVVQV